MATPASYRVRASERPRADPAALSPHRAVGAEEAPAELVGGHVRLAQDDEPGPVDDLTAKALEADELDPHRPGLGGAIDEGVPLLARLAPVTQEENAIDEGRNGRARGDGTDLTLPEGLGTGDPDFDATMGDESRRRDAFEAHDGARGYWQQRRGVATARSENRREEKGEDGSPHGGQ